MIRGVVASLSASVMFALLSYYVTLLDPLAGVKMFGWRNDLQRAGDHPYGALRGRVVAGS
jgi:hypothetical protein